MTAEGDTMEPLQDATAREKVRNSKFGFLNLFQTVVLCAILKVSMADDTFVNLGQEPLQVKAANEKSETRLAIVSTWRGHSEAWANSWLQYHISVGFSRFYLFFDDPDYDKKLIEKLSKTSEYKPFLTIVKVDKAYRKRFWTPDEQNRDPEQLLLPRYGVYLKTDHMARQQLNVARAGVMAVADQVNWLLHLDSDEMFWVERLKSGIGRSFFEQLHNRKITHVTLLNDEVIPLKPHFDYKSRSKDPFHQRMNFKRNFMALTRNEDIEQVQYYERNKDTAFFLGYMCGKGGINVELWRKNMGENMPILPQDVVGFALDSWQPGNVTLINQDTSKIQPYISSKKIKIAVSTTVARILHYVNPDFDSLKKKFAASKKFNKYIYDLSRASEKQKSKFQKWKRFWAAPESMPSDRFYNEMWQKVQKTLKTNDDKHAYDFYSRAAMAPKGKELDKYLSKGVIYKNKEVYQFLNQIEKRISKQKNEKKDKLLLDFSSGNKFIDGGKGVKNENRTFPLHSCKGKGPHFFCDIDDCCSFVAKPQFTFTKRLLGYKRYERLQWWRPGIKWPQ